MLLPLINIKNNMPAQLLFCEWTLEVLSLFLSTTQGWESLEMLIKFMERWFFFLVKVDINATFCKAKLSRCESLKEWIKVISCRSHESETIF